MGVRLHLRFNRADRQVVRFAQAVVRSAQNDGGWSRLGQSIGGKKLVLVNGGGHPEAALAGEGFPPHDAAAAMDAYAAPLAHLRRQGHVKVQLGVKADLGVKSKVDAFGAEVPAGGLNGDGVLRETDFDRDSDPVAAMLSMLLAF